MRLYFHRNTFSFVYSLNNFKINEMKNLIFLFAIFFGLKVFGQETKPLKKTPIIFYQANDSTSLSKDKTVLQLFGNATIKTAALEITHADKIVFNSETNEMIVTGKFDYLMRGALIVKDVSKDKTLRYRIGDDTVYIN